MCKEVSQIIQNMDSRDVEVMLALHCAPVLTGIKTSNLVLIETSRETAFRNLLRTSHLAYFRLNRANGKTAWLVFHRSSLENYLRTKEVRDILISLGYNNLSFGHILREFQIRYQTYKEQGTEFPHEMGLFLGYPYDDVIGFMENEGRNSLYTGYWKVYHNVPEKLKIFQAYDQAQMKMIRYLAEGKGLPLVMEHKAAI